jgi:hypothetical protein
MPQWRVNVLCAAPNDVPQDTLDQLEVNLRGPSDLLVFAVTDVSLRLRNGILTEAFTLEAESVSSAWIRTLVVINRAGVASGLAPLDVFGLCVEQEG